MDGWIVGRQAGLAGRTGRQEAIIRDAYVLWCSVCSPAVFKDGLNGVKGVFDLFANANVTRSHNS